MTRRIYGRYTKVHVKPGPGSGGRTYFTIASGGAVTSGLASYRKQASLFAVFAYAGTSGPSASGTAFLTRTRARAGSGGAFATGAAATVRQGVGAHIFTWAGIGGGTSSGVAQTTDTYVYVTWVTFEIPAT